MIDATGRVHFHTDTQRNTFENLFTETDENRQLRSLVASGLNGTVTTDYWGRPYFAHVHHTDVFGWSIVTLFERQHLRHLVSEWTVGSLVLLAAYWALWNLALLAVTATGVPWLWPDRFRHDRYFALGLLYVLCLGGFALAASTMWFTRSMIGLAGFAVPIGVCAITAVVLRRRPAAVANAARLDVDLEYCVPAALLLIVVGVLPGAAFVARSYDAHIEAYLKHRQIELARAVAAWDGPARPAPCGQTGKAERPPGWHLEFLYGTRICAQAEPVPPSAHSAGHGGDSDSWSRLEALVPYVSEASVLLRELVHRQADDGSWMSERDGPELTVRLPVGMGDTDGHLVAATTIPAVGTPELTVFLLVALAVLGGTAYAIARFVTRFVFLGNVTAPPWAVGRLAIPEGRAVVIACDPPALLARITGGQAIDLAAAATLPIEDALAAVRELSTSASEERPLVTVLGRPDRRADTLARQMGILAAFAREQRHALLVLSPYSLADLTGTGAYAAAAATRDAAEALAACDVIEFDWRARAGTNIGPLALSVERTPTTQWWRLVGPTSDANVQVTESKTAAAERLVRAEERAHVGLEAIGNRVRQLDAFRGRRLSRTEALEEFDEAAQSFYAALWNDCTDAEKLELLQIAEFGIAHAGNAAPVRQLIARRLVTKDPELRLMNKTFQRFVLRCRTDGAAEQADVQRIEGALTESAWDRYRAPVALTVLGVAVFLFVTQRDTYNTTVGAAVTLATQLPNILKALTMVVHRDPAAIGSRPA